MDIKSIFILVLYASLILLAIAGAIFIIKLVFTLKRVDKVIDNVDGKLNQLNGLFAVIGNTTNIISGFNDKLAVAISNAISKVFNKKRRKKHE